jgi:hypothetical protein
MVVEVNDAGEVLLPAQLVQATPHTKLDVERNGRSLVVTPVGLTVPANRKSIDSLPHIPGHFADPDMTFRREDIYGPDGR